MDFGLRGQVVLITGGVSGIAAAFGGCAAQVVLTYLRNRRRGDHGGHRGAGGKALALQADLTQDGEVERVVATTVAQFGGVDVLVANAGGLLQRSRVTECSRELWDLALSLNLTSLFLCCRAVLPHMERAGRGCIISISSLAAHDGGGEGASHYAAAKGGVLTFTRALAKEVGPGGIRVNGIAPGLIATQFHDRFTAPAVRQAVVERTPLRREGLPADVAGAALFLASPDAAYITGEPIEVNGGQGV